MRYVINKIEQAYIRHKTTSMAIDMDTGSINRLFLWSSVGYSFGYFAGYNAHAKLTLEQTNKVEKPCIQENNEIALPPRRASEEEITAWIERSGK